MAALGLSPSALRELAAAMEQKPGTDVRAVALAALERFPAPHAYAVALRRLARWGGTRFASDVTADDIAAWAKRAGNEARAGPRAVHGRGAEETFILAARAAYQGAVEAGLVPANPAAKVRLPARAASRRMALTTDQLADAHLGLLASGRDPELDDLVFSFLRETACRRSGAAGLTRQALAPHTGMVRVVEKYGKVRWVPASAHLLHRLVALAHRRGHDDCPLVFHRSDGGHLTGRWFEGFARRLQGLPWAAELGVSAHWLRHTTLTDVDRLAGSRVAAAYAGHAATGGGVTGIYTKPAMDELQVAHAMLFFPDATDARDPSVPPRLFRRIAASARHVSFIEADAAPGYGRAGVDVGRGGGRERATPAGLHPRRS